MAGPFRQSGACLRRILKSCNKPSTPQPPSLPRYTPSLTMNNHSHPHEMPSPIISKGRESLDTIRRRDHPYLPSEPTFQPMPHQPHATGAENILAAADITTRGFCFAMPESDLALVAARSIRAVALASSNTRSGDSALDAAGTTAEFDAP